MTDMTKGTGSRWPRLIRQTTKGARLFSSGIGYTAWYIFNSSPREVLLIAPAEPLRSLTESLQATETQGHTVGL